MLKGLDNQVLGFTCHPKAHFSSCTVNLVVFWILCVNIDPRELYHLLNWYQLLAYHNIPCRSGLNPGYVVRSDGLMVQGDIT